MSDKLGKDGTAFVKEEKLNKEAIALAEKEAEKKAKEEEKAREKAEKEAEKAEKEAEKAAKEAEKAEKEAEKAAKEAEKARKKAEEEAEKLAEEKAKETEQDSDHKKHRYDYFFRQFEFLKKDRTQEIESNYKTSYDVIAGVTRIANAHGYMMYEGEKYPDEGKLEYRGYEISTLINNFVRDGRFGFEECAFLLFFGHLPTEQELLEFNDILAAYRRLPTRFSEDIIMKAPSKSIMNKMASAVLSLYAYDDNADDTGLENMLHQRRIQFLVYLSLLLQAYYHIT